MNSIHLTGPSFQRLNGLRGENLENYRHVKFRWYKKVWMDAGWVLVMDEAGTGDSTGSAVGALCKAASKLESPTAFPKAVPVAKQLFEQSIV